MSDIRKQQLLEKLKDIGENYACVEYTIYAFLPKRKRTYHNGNVYREELQHVRTAVFTTSDLTEAKQVYDEYETFYPAIKATVLFD